jgi:ATP-dependent Clp protease ATP-binding subunit ClpA
MVRSVWGEHPQLPAPVLAWAAQYASELGRDVASDDLFLLALAGLDETCPARQALNDAGVDADRLRAQIRKPGDAPRDARGLVFPPSFYWMNGRAEAFAATLGDGTIAPEHVLLALIWDPTSMTSTLLWEMGVSRERIVESLARSAWRFPPHRCRRRANSRWANVCGSAATRSVG